MQRRRAVFDRFAAAAVGRSACRRVEVMNFFLPLPTRSLRRGRRIDVALNAPCEATGAPVFAAHAMVHEEESVGVVLVLHSAQPQIVGAPEGALPACLEIVGL